MYRIIKKIVFCSILGLVSTFNSVNLFAQKVSVNATIDSLQLLIGEQTKLSIEVNMDANQKLRFPAFNDTIVKGLEIVDVAKPDTQFLNDRKKMVVSQEYTVTSFDSALYYIPPFQVLIDGKPFMSNSLALKVISIPVDTLHADKFFGPKGINEVPIMWDDVMPILLFFILLAIFIVLTYYLYRRYKDNKPIIKTIKIEPKLPPHQLALKEIEKIKENKALKVNDPKEYYTELTGVLRNYMKDRFGFNATEMTSSEIIDHLLQKEDKESIKDLTILFQTSDLVKFAKHSPLINESDMNLVNAIDFINNTKIDQPTEELQEPKEIQVEEKRSKRGRIILMSCIIVLIVASIVVLYFIVSDIYNLRN